MANPLEDMAAQAEQVLLRDGKVDVTSLRNGLSDEDFLAFYKMVSAHERASSHNITLVAEGNKTLIEMNDPYERMKPQIPGF